MSESLRIVIIHELAGVRIWPLGSRVVGRGGQGRFPVELSSKPSAAHTETTTEISELLSCLCAHMYYVSVIFHEDKGMNGGKIPSQYMKVEFALKSCGIFDPTV